MHFAEMLNADGTVYTANLRSARATDAYILKERAKRFRTRALPFMDSAMCRSAACRGRQRRMR